jgi:GTP-binding protein
VCLDNRFVYVILRHMFYDETQVHVKAGDGGDGSVAFRHEKYVPFGGPSGGDGGKGGDVVLYVDPHLSTLYRFTRKRHFRAERGKHGRGKDQHGARGAELRVAVPPGTVVYDAGSQEVLGDLTQLDDELTVARGGRGGRGNARFTTPTNQAPRIAEHGEPGEELLLRLELKLLADVGVVGMPNAGKSTLLAATTAARPKIADYPFTTLQPNLGVVVLDDQTQFVMADIPGLIEGASEGKGLGHQFLRHIERTRVIIHLLDGLSQDPVADLATINRELAAFGRGLEGKPQVVAVNKADLAEVQERWPEIRAALEAQGEQSVVISAATKSGTRELLWSAARILDRELKEPQRQPVPVFRPPEDEEAFTVVREEDGWRVRGKGVERLAAMTVWNLDEAVRRFLRILEDMGVTDELVALGVQAADTVRIGEAEFTWEE